MIYPLQANLNFYLRPELDRSLTIHITRGDVEGAIHGPQGSYFTLLSQYMDFTPRIDRHPIRCTSQDEVLECVDAVTRLVGRKLLIHSAADAWYADQWGIRLGTSDTMTVITFLYAGAITELEVTLRLEGYIVNDIGAHP